MRKGKYSDEQVIAILREQEAGRPTAEICRKYGISNATFYKWKSKFGGMQVSDAKRLKSLEEENRRLKSKRRLTTAVRVTCVCAARASSVWRGRRTPVR